MYALLVYVISKKYFHSGLQTGFFKIILTILYFYIPVLILSSCSTSTEPDDSLVIFKSDKTNYLPTDTLDVIITNNSSDNFFYGLRCGGYLEMFYQKYDRGNWSDDKWFWYMSLKCLTLPDTLKPGEKYIYKLPAYWFKDTGTFRLVMGDLHTNNFVIGG